MLIMVKMTAMGGELHVAPAAPDGGLMTEFDCKVYKKTLDAEINRRMVLFPDIKEFRTICVIAPGGSDA